MNIKIMTITNAGIRVAAMLRGRVEPPMNSGSCAAAMTHCLWLPFPVSVASFNPLSFQQHSCFIGLSAFFSYTFQLFPKFSTAVLCFQGHSRVVVSKKNSFPIATDCQKLTVDRRSLPINHFPRLRGLFVARMGRGAEAEVVPVGVPRRNHTLLR